MESLGERFVEEGLCQLVVFDTTMDMAGILAIFCMKFSHRTNSFLLKGFFYTTTLVTNSMITRVNAHDDI